MKCNVMVSPTAVCTASTLQEKYDYLYFWPFACCEVYSVETLEEASVLVRQIYYARFLACPEFYGRPAMELPATAPIAIMDTSVPMASATPSSPMMPMPGAQMGIAQNTSCPAPSPAMPADQRMPANSPVAFPQPGPLVRMGVWSVSYEGGFAVENDLNKLLEQLEAKRNPHAIWWLTPETASYWARKDYIDRFVRFYDLRDIDIHLPNVVLKPGQEYNDSRFEDGGMEISESTAMKNLRNAGLL